MKTERILDTLNEMFPNAECELIHHNPFELAVAVVLSAQATDVSVNKVTPALFEKYPTAEVMAQAELKEIEDCIRTIGLYHNKAKSIQALSKKLVCDFHGEMPSTMEELLTLPGVGRKSANVILSVCFNVPAIAVDTHVERISKRLGLAQKKDDVYTVEKKLMKKIDQSQWSHAHHLFIFFGRYFCKAKNPMCTNCPLKDLCKEKNKNIKVRSENNERK